MARRLMLTAVVLVLLLGAGASRAGDRNPTASQCDPTKQGCFQLQSTIAFTSTRDDPGGNPQLAAEVYLMNTTATGGPDATSTHRLTNNGFGDSFAALSPDGKKIVFDSNRLTAGTVIDGITYNTISDLFLMNTDGSEQALLTRGSSATWSPDSKNIAFHGSASYYVSGGSVSGIPIRTDPGSAMSDSDIFVVNVDDLVEGVEPPRNITNTPDQIEDDVDWSSSPTAAPDGQTIVFTSHPTSDAANPSNQAEIYV